MQCCQRLLFLGIIPSFNKEIHNDIQSAVFDIKRSARGNNRFAMEGEADAGSLDHFQVIGTVAARNRTVAKNAIEHAKHFHGAAFTVSIQDLSAAGTGGLSTLPFFPDLPAWSGGGRTAWLALPAFLWETTGTEESGSCGCC